MYSCYLFLIFSASFRSLLFLSFIVPIFAWNVPLVSLIFLKRSLVFPILLFSSISLHWSSRKAFLSLLAVLWNSAFRWVYLSLSPLPFDSFLSYLYTLLRQPLCLLAFLFIWNGFGPCLLFSSVQFSRSVVSDSLWPHGLQHARPPCLIITNSRSLLKLMSIELVLPSNHLTLCRPLLLPSIFPSIRVFSNESALCIRWPKYWSFSFDVSLSSEHQDWSPLGWTMSRTSL